MSSRSQGFRHHLPPVSLSHLQAGYAVIFLTRTGSIQPFTQDLPLKETVPLLQSLLTLQQPGSYTLQEPAAGRVAGILQKVEEVQRSQLLLTVPFTTIFEYLQVCVITLLWCGKTQLEIWQQQLALFQM